MTTETQETITIWGLATFGVNPAMGMASRMNVEVAELLEKCAGPDQHLQDLCKAAVRLAEAISARQHELEAQGGVAYDQPYDVEGALDECADVHIVLTQVASILGGDLQDRVDAKMKINRARTWKKVEGGRHQHV